MTCQEMLDGHRAGVEAFPAETEGRGNQPLEPRVENGVKVFELTAEEMQWETKPGMFVDAMAFNGTVPGPEIRVNEGDHVRIVVQNQMAQPTVAALPRHDGAERAWTACRTSRRTRSCRAAP